MRKILLMMLCALFYSLTLTGCKEEEQELPKTNYEKLYDYDVVFNVFNETNKYYDIILVSTHWKRIKRIEPYGSFKETYHASDLIKYIEDERDLQKGTLDIACIEAITEKGESREISKENNKFVLWLHYK